MLTKGLDNVPGTSGNDTIIGSIDSGNAELNTLSAQDIINGGAGTDTLKIAHNDNGTTAATVTLGNLSNVEIVEVESAAVLGVTVNTTATTGVTNLNVIKAAGVVAATAGATTDVSVAMKAAGAAVAVVGGNNVNVTLTDVAAADAVTVGAGTAAKGDVVVDVTGKAATADATLSSITVTGGKTISVTQKATSDASAAATDTTGITINQGAITATANAATTTVTIKQDAAVDGGPAGFTTGGTTATTSVKFGALKAGDAITVGGLTVGGLTVGGLTFTAAEDMTAAEVAAAFANLTTGAAALIPAANSGLDTQSGAKLAQGEYTGEIAGWTSGAVSGDTVVFTSTAAKTALGGTGVDIATNFATGSTSVAPVPTFTDGKADNAGAAGGVLGVNAGAVTVNGGAALATVTVDGYAGGGASSIATASNALETLNLSNGGAFGVTSSASTLALNLEKVTDAVAFTTAPTTLNVKSIGNNTSALNAVQTTTLNVSGTGTLNATGAALTAAKTIKVTETAGLNLTGAALTALESVDTTGTTGTTTVAILGTQATYAGGAGVDNVTISNANVAANKAIDLGDGNDTLTLTGVVAVPTVELKGGEGTDTLAMTSANAVALSANGNFEAKISGFEKLSLTDAAATTGTVDLANMDDISYVVSNNSVAVTSAAANTVYAGAVASLTNGDTIAFTYNGTALTATLAGVAGATATAAEVQTAIDAALLAGAGGTTFAAGAVVASFTNAGADLTLTAAANPVTDTLAGGNYTDLDAANTTASSDEAAAGTAATVTYAGVETAITAGDTFEVSLDGSAQTVMVGPITTTALAAVQAALDAAFDPGDVVASFVAGDLVLTAANLGDTLVGRVFTDADIDNITTSTDAVAAGTNAFVTFSSVRASITAGDTIALTYNGTPAAGGFITIGAIAAPAGNAEKLDAINVALNAEFGIGNLIATFDGDNLVVTTSVFGDTLASGDFTDNESTQAIAGVDTVAAGTAAEVTYAGVEAAITAGDTFEVDLNGSAQTVMVGPITTTALAAVQAALDIAFGHDIVVASFVAGDLVLTAANLGDTLVGGDFTDVDIANTTASTDEEADGTEATVTYAGVEAAITAGDTFEVDLNGSAQTVMVGPITTTALAAVQAALDAAFDPGDVVASFVAGDLVLTAANLGDTLVGGDFTDVDMVAPTIAATDNAANAAVAALTLDNMANNGTLELLAAGAGVIVEMADATGASDAFNIVTKVNATDLDFGTVTVADVETINVTAINTTPVNTVTGAATISEATLALAANKATVVDLGNSNAALDLDIAASTKVASVNGASITGALTLDLSAHNGVAVTVTAGSGADVLSASEGPNAKADKLNGGAGNDILEAGSNSAELTGGAGADLFVLNSVGNKEANTYSIIKDFDADDLLDLGNVASFADLTAVMQPTSQFSNYVQAALEQAGVNDAVWFSFEGNSYVVVDAGADSTNFVNGQDIIIQLAGVDLTNASFNATYSTIALA